jgi:RNA polymerase sigma-70 factor (ECF subfamily)
MPLAASAAADASVRVAESAAAGASVRVAQSDPAVERAPIAQSAPAEPSVAAWYREHFAFVWRTLRRWGVPLQNLDDAVQDVFLVVHRRLAEFEPTGSARAWLFGIARNVAQAQRRKLGSALRTEVVFLECEHGVEDADPARAALQREAAELVQRSVDMLDEDKRWVFVLAELEHMSGPELAEALQLNLNTAYARLRAARKQFVASVRRERARAKE